MAVHIKPHRAANLKPESLPGVGPFCIPAESPGCCCPFEEVIALMYEGTDNAARGGRVIAPSLRGDSI
ncbi:hypothetical protein DPEC_G00223740 [Dallia pectoralis]|uniref:Uncharacterized protein n=1 Tax=Dallia pectoralis TaxID=75939 RepID=A0ACC2G003_DALPE|nr:hypothetical protein DPEC_G00223740 [Dallia pectoralis]